MTGLPHNGIMKPRKDGGRYRGDFLDYLGPEDMGVFTAHGSENGPVTKLDELKNFDLSLS